MEKLHILETSSQHAARLMGLLLADQGANVYRERGSSDVAAPYLDRGKRVKQDGQEYQVVIGDLSSFKDWNNGGGSQIRVGITAALPGDGLEQGATEDELNGLAGFYTDLAVTKAMLGFKQLYTPLPLCSTYAGVIGAVSIMSQLIRMKKTGTGKGCDITVSRLAAGLSAIGALALDVDGLPEHLTPKSLLSLPPALIPHIEKSRADPKYFEWLKRRLSPFAGCFECKDGRLVMPVAAVNRRLARQMLETLGIWQQVQEAGIVDVDPYDKANFGKADCNIALPGDFGIMTRMKVAALIEAAFAKEDSMYWEHTMGKAGVPCAVVRTFDEWKETPQAKQSALIVDGLLGKSFWTSSSADGDVAAVGGNQSIPVDKPLQGIRVVDLANVIAGPACGRMFAELGASVIKIDSANPDHVPVVTIGWQMELGQGKKSILLDLHTSEGKDILKGLVKSADVVLANKLDTVMSRLGVGKDSLRSINPNAIGCQVTAWCGSQPNDHDNYPGYDPLLQAATGIMARFGTSVETPELHGVASCVDYITGYLACLAGVTALYGKMDGKNVTWATTSLEAGASLVQWPFVFKDAPVGTPECLEKVKIQSVKDIKSTYGETPSETIRLKKTDSDGVSASNLFEPTWFVFDGKVASNDKAPVPGNTRDARDILDQLNMSNKLEHLIEKGVVGRPLWSRS
jgi:crotonobetainyl-CoA:carnitine CoA-transferase CaiB-like acyl-CoA transferase